MELLKVSKFVIALFAVVVVTNAVGNEIDRANAFLKKYEASASDISYKSSLAAWTYNTNITDYNSEQMVKYICPY